MRWTPGKYVTGSTVILCATAVFLISLAGRHAHAHGTFRTEVVPQIQPTGQTRYVAFLAQDRIILSSDLHNQASLWDVATGTLIRTLLFPDKDTTLSFSLGGMKLLAVNGERGSTLWDLASGQMVHTLPAAKQGMFAPDGRTVVLDGKLLDAATGSQIRSLEGNWNDVQAIDISPDGKTVMAAASDGTVSFFDFDSGRQRHSEMAHAVGESRFSPDGRVLMTYGYRADLKEYAIKLWDGSTGRQLRTLAMSGSGFRKTAAFSPDSRTIALTRGKQVELRDVATGSLLRSFEAHTPSVGEVEFSPDGRILLTASGLTKLWDIATGKLLETLDSSGPFEFSSNGRSLIISDNGLRLWDTGSAKAMRTFGGPSETIYSVTFSRDGRYVLSAASGSVFLAEAASGKLLHSFKAPDSDGAHTGSGVRAAMSPDGRTVASHGTHKLLDDSAVRIWDTATGRMLHDLPSFLTSRCAKASCPWRPSGRP